MSKVRPLIAVIDDEEPVRKALGRLLQSVGMAVETFSGGGEFLAALGHASAGLRGAGFAHAGGDRL